MNRITQVRPLVATAPLRVTERTAVLRAPVAKRRHDWRVDRAAYLIECGRLDDLVREGLEHLIADRA